MMNLFKSRRAFTLLELLIVLLIIGILIAIGLYRYQSVVDASRDKETQASVRAVFIAAQADKIKTGAWADTDTLGSNLNGMDGITVSGFNPGDPPVDDRVLVYVNGDTLIALRKVENGDDVYCMKDDGSLITSGKLNDDGDDCVGSTTTPAPPVEPAWSLTSIAGIEVRQNGNNFELRQTGANTLDFQISGTTASLGGVSTMVGMVDRSADGSTFASDFLVFCNTGCPYGPQSVSFNTSNSVIGSGINAGLQNSDWIPNMPSTNQTEGWYVMGVILCKGGMADCASPITLPTPLLLNP